MRAPFDSLGKEILCAALPIAGRVDAPKETAPETQQADVAFEPDPARAAALDGLGLLGRIAHVWVLFELFHDAPSLLEVRACMSKQLAFYLERVRGAWVGRYCAVQLLRRAAHDNIDFRRVCVGKCSARCVDDGDAPRGVKL